MLPGAVVGQTGLLSFAVAQPGKVASRQLQRHQRTTQILDSPAIRISLKWYALAQDFRIGGLSLANMMRLLVCAFQLSVPVAGASAPDLHQHLRPPLLPGRHG